MFVYLAILQLPVSRCCDEYSSDDGCLCKKLPNLSKRSASGTNHVEFSETILVQVRREVEHKSQAILASHGGRY